MPSQDRKDIQYTTHPKATPSFDVCSREYNCRVLATEFKGYWCELVCCGEGNLEGIRYAPRLLEVTHQTADTLGTYKGYVPNFGRSCQAFCLIREATHELVEGEGC